MALAMLFTSCNFLDVEPVGKVIPKETAEYRAMLTTVYSKKIPRYKRFLVVRGDELQLPSEYSWSYSTYFDLGIWNDQNPNPETMSYPYEDFYNAIFYSNHIITEKDKIVSDGSEPVNQVVAEAYALRAFLHFELVNIFAKPYSPENLSAKAIPISTFIDIEQEYPRATLQEVYAQIESDLANAELLMVNNEQKPPFNYRFSKEALLALKARIALYKGEWSKAYQIATELIKMRPQLENMNDAASILPYNYKSKEAILAITTSTDLDIQDDMPLANELVALYNKESDKRFFKYFKERYGSYKVAKGSNAEEKSTFRTAEIYLIAAEAAANLGNDAAAKELILALTVNRLTPEFFATESVRVNALSHDDLVVEIQNERRRELAAEGHRWFDLRRTTKQEIVKESGGKKYILQQNDDRYTVAFPKSAIINNPLLRD